MRGLPKWLPFAAALLLVAGPAIAASTVGGRGYGVSIWPVWELSAGKWERADLLLPAGTHAVTVKLTWAQTVPFLYTDYDLTLWKPGAFSDGLATPAEMLLFAWHRTGNPREEVVSGVLPGGQIYPLTIEPIQSLGIPWTLQTNVGALESVDSIVPGVKGAIP